MGRLQKPQGIGKCPRTSDSGKLLPGPGLKEQEWGLLAEQMSTRCPHQTAAQPGGGGGGEIPPVLDSPCQSDCRLPHLIAQTQVEASSQGHLSDQVPESPRASLLGSTGSRSGGGGQTDLPTTYGTVLPSLQVPKAHAKDSHLREAWPSRRNCRLAVGLEADRPVAWQSHTKEPERSHPKPSC